MIKLRIDRRPLKEQYSEMSGMEKFLAWMLIPATIYTITLWVFIFTM